MIPSCNCCTFIIATHSCCDVPIPPDALPNYWIKWHPVCSSAAITSLLSCLTCCTFKDDHVYMSNCTDMLPHNSLFTWSAVYSCNNKQLTKSNLHIVVLSLLLKSTIDKPITLNKCPSVT